MPTIKKWSSFHINYVKGEKRGPREIKRRLDFLYMNGRGTFYRLARKHPPTSILNAKIGQRVSVVLYNLHTKQLDEVVFIMKSTQKIGTALNFRGTICDIPETVEIDGTIHAKRKINRISTILVQISAEPMPLDYEFP